MTKVMNYEKIRMIPFTNKVNKSYAKKKVIANDDNQKHHKVRYHSDYAGRYRCVAHNFCNLIGNSQRNFCGISR